MPHNRAALTARREGDQLGRAHLRTLRTFYEAGRVQVGAVGWAQPSMSGLHGNPQGYPAVPHSTKRRRRMLGFGLHAGAGSSCSPVRNRSVGACPSTRPNPRLPASSRISSHSPRCAPEGKEANRPTSCVRGALRRPIKPPAPAGRGGRADGPGAWPRPPPTIAASPPQGRFCAGLSPRDSPVGKTRESTPPGGAPATPPGSTSAATAVGRVC